MESLDRKFLELMKSLSPTKEVEVDIGIECQIEQTESILTPMEKLLSSVSFRPIRVKLHPQDIPAYAHPTWKTIMERELQGPKGEIQHELLIPYIDYVRSEVSRTRNVYRGRVSWEFFKELFRNVLEPNISNFFLIEIVQRENNQTYTLSKVHKELYETYEFPIFLNSEDRHFEKVERLANNLQARYRTPDCNYVNACVSFQRKGLIKINDEDKECKAVARVKKKIHSFLRRKGASLYSKIVGEKSWKIQYDFIGNLTSICCGYEPMDHTKFLEEEGLLSFILPYPGRACIDITRKYLLQTHS